MFKSIDNIPSLDIKKGMLFRILSSNKSNIIIQGIFEEGATSIDKELFEKNFKEYDV